MDIQNIDSAPDYIHSFIASNYEQLNKIYGEGNEENSEGILFCKCSLEDNRIDIQFMNEDMIIEIITKESWDNLKTTIQNDKKLLFIQDLDLDCVFLLYI
jgi:hypothetical protein